MSYTYKNTEKPYLLMKSKMAIDVHLNASSCLGNVFLYVRIKLGGSDSIGLWMLRLCVSVFMIPVQAKLGILCFLVRIL